MAAICYTITPADPNGHLFTVELRIKKPQASGQVLRLPAWIPGSYMIRDFAKNIISLTAYCQGKTIALHPLDKHSWQVAPCAGPLQILYQIYAYDLSVRSSYLDAEHGFFNGSSVFLCAEGFSDQPQQVQIKPPAHARDWRVATALPRIKTTKPLGFGWYQAPDYDALIDHPVQLGRFISADFTACGAQHTIAITGHVPNLDIARLQTDFHKICTHQIQLFEPAQPRAAFIDSSDHYVFMIQAWGDGNYGGLEHRASTALICGRNALPVIGQAATSESYRDFLGLVSHEYFHTWHVKRIKPAAFAPYDLSREVHTPLLWLFEGFTSYYDDLTLVRSGLISPNDYLKLLAKTMSSVLRNSGRSKQTLAQSSFDAWTKYYRQDENSPNAIVSYYTKGAMVALYLDLLIRTKTNSKKSLDDFMRLLWSRFGRDFYQGQPHGLKATELAALLTEATGCDLRTALRTATQTTKDLPLERLFADLGIAWSNQAERQTPSLGIKTRSQNGECLIVHAYQDEAAHRAGLSALDVLIALDGLRVTAANLDNLLARYQAGQTLRVLAFRRDQLIEGKIVLDPAGKHQLKLMAMDQIPTTKKALRQAWLQRV